jgi:hypothetical protein
MLEFRSGRILGVLAAVAPMLVLAACGGSSSSNGNVQQSLPPAVSITVQPVGPSISSGQSATLTVAATGTGTLSYQWYQGPSGTSSNSISGATASSYATPVLTASTSYWVQVSDSAGSANSNTAVVLISGPRHVQALLFPVLTPSSPIYSSFISNVLPNITGVSVSMAWNEIETSQGTYDFTAFDASLQPFVAAGRKVNLIVWPATEGGDNDPSTVGSTPAYVFSATYATQVGAPNPQDMAVCGDYTGDSGNPDYTSALSGGGGIWNESTSSDLSGLPVSYELPFMTAYKNFIAEVITHYNNNPTTPIGYIRFGMSQDGESSPLCNQFWPNYSETGYINYVTTMTQWITAQHPTMTILQDLHAPGATPDYTYPDQEAALAVVNQEGFGTNGWQKSDITNFAANQPCDANWCVEFAQYTGTTYSGTPITLSLQTGTYSDPTGASQIGSLVNLVPFAQQNGANNLELYLADLGLAFDQGNYCNYPHATCPADDISSYSTGYAQAIVAFLSGSQ